MESVVKKGRLRLSEVVVKKMNIIPIQYAESVLPECMIWKGGAADKTRPIVFRVFLIRTEDRTILVDAGCETMPGFDMKHFIGPIRALANIGIKTDDITDLVITHAHHDHIACASRFGNAVVYIQKDEYEIGRDYLQGCRRIVTFDDGYTVCGGVTIRTIGGHSIGSCIVEIDGGTNLYVITGDECYLQLCLDRHLQTGASCNEEKSRAFIETYSADCYITLTCHDPGIPLDEQKPIMPEQNLSGV